MFYAHKPLNTKDDERMVQAEEGSVDQRSTEQSKQKTHKLNHNIKLAVSGINMQKKKQPKKLKLKKLSNAPAKGAKEEDW